MGAALDIKGGIFWKGGVYSGSVAYSCQKWGGGGILFSGGGVDYGRVADV